jgi:hypothetical protein
MLMETVLSSNVVHVHANLFKVKMNFCRKETTIQQDRIALSLNRTAKISNMDTFFRVTRLFPIDCI